MATTYTTYFNLGKQEDHADKFSMAVLTENADKIDAALHGLAEDVAQLQTDTLADRAALVELVDTGPKNELSWSTVDKVHNGITFTVNGDGTVTATFENFCPVAFLVNETEVVAAEGTCALCHGFFNAGASLIPALCLICFIIVITLLLLCGWMMYRYMRKKAEQETEK